MDELYAVNSDLDLFIVDLGSMNSKSDTLSSSSKKLRLTEKKI